MFNREMEIIRNRYWYDAFSLPNPFFYLKENIIQLICWTLFQNRQNEFECLPLSFFAISCCDASEANHHFTSIFVYIIIFINSKYMIIG
ncbi:MAG: hypothetical protein AUI36_12545 [Cyanobacteria bacterium 13_1_40CM_2_61_4]|nr:MAG: hypothetical protein AUI36_12545 [Cyanobacteria bacterium 13_1_40CM_2_61_4]